jgi:hypothetical protein
MPQMQFAFFVALATFAVGGLLLYGARLARIEGVTYPRAVLAAAVGMFGGQLLSYAVLIGLGDMAPYVSLSAALIVLLVFQIAAVALAMRAPLKKAALAWAVGLLVPGLIFAAIVVLIGGRGEAFTAGLELSAVRDAIRAYSSRNDGLRPERLEDLVRQKYLPIDPSRMGAYAYLSGLGPEAELDTPIAWEDPAEIPDRKLVCLSAGGEVVELDPATIVARVEAAIANARARGENPVKTGGCRFGPKEAQIEGE